MLEHGADVGIGLDGDGDRLILVDAAGNLLNGDHIVYLIAQDRQRRDVLSGGVVGTLMSNYGLEKALQDLHIPFVRSKVGDRYVLESLRDHDWKIGGEPSGHVVCLDKTTTGDGIIAALQVLGVMIKQDRSLADLSENLIMFPQTLINLPTKMATMLAADTRVLAAVSDVQAKLSDKGRVLLRASGTEPLLRVMIEGENHADVCQNAECLAEEIRYIERNLAVCDSEA